MPTAAPPTRPARPSTIQRGTSRAIYAVTGVVDEVQDLIVPGAFARTLAKRPVKTVWHHGWKDPVGVVVLCEEWLPGDPRFRDIPDWPAEAGALVATVIYNLRTRQGRDCYEQVRQWHEHKQAAFSIGYRVPDTGASKRGDGVRVIHDLDLFEVSPVLHGAHPLTRSLEVKSATGGHDGLEYKTTPSHVEIDVVATPTGEAIKVAGLAVKAGDTGRLLMIQRALDDDDPAAGTWEIPGGHLEDGEDPLAAALREWAEETGSILPGTATVVGSWTAPNGIYRGFVAVVPTEDSVPINTPHDDRRVTNPDDPKGDATEVTAWWPIAALPDMSLLRPECRETPWELLAGAALPHAPEPKPIRPISQNVLEGIIAATQNGVTAETKSARATVAAARALLPLIEHKSARATVVEAKSRFTHLPEASVMSPNPLPESQEQLRARLADSVRELLDQDGRTWTCIEGTYPDRVIVSVHAEDEQSSSHYAIPYTLTAEGQFSLGTPQPVELATVVLPEGASAQRAATEAEDVDARLVKPTVEALTEATARLNSTSAGPEHLDGIRDKVRTLVAALSAKGLTIDHAPDETQPSMPVPETSSTAGPTGMDLWDEYTFNDEDDEDEVSTEDTPPTEDAVKDDDTVRLDADEVKAALALMRG
ncbi:NUDIX domain-containing protein [Streptomyces sp. SP18BB07]|uniref:NUDIX domain-containing protein n=1 Tax=Streptomyces sp. SP18BB07 TaxID=3002522 RepID=UPI002E785D72|nr:NUDIX domain-containing protein [Streptomyces sp. SP18BB07]MEE1764409.1 NUDIX domain-containing protein [Streptomyces sp. SP18BB07]